MTTPSLADRICHERISVAIQIFTAYAQYKYIYVSGVGVIQCARGETKLYKIGIYVEQHVMCDNVYRKIEPIVQLYVGLLPLANY